MIRANSPSFNEHDARFINRQGIELDAFDDQLVRRRVAEIVEPAHGFFFPQAIRDLEKYVYISEL